MGSENAGSNEIHNPYRDLVARHRARNPALGWFDEFFQRPEKYVARLAVLEFSPGNVQLRKITGVIALEQYWRDIDYGNGSNNATTIKGRLYILEDLSEAYMSALGSQFKLDPMLFVRYGSTPSYSLKNQKELEQLLPWRLQPLFTSQMESEALTLLYHEIREFGEIEREKFMNSEIKWETCANVARKIEQIERKDPKTGLVRRNVTFWSRKNGGDKPWDGKF
jgi:hypothetical protein